MAPNKMLTIVLAGFVLCSAGCSGSRLRNLVTRSDYKTIQELEALDALAEAEAADSSSNSDAASTSLASQERDVEAPEPKERAKKGFSIAKLFGRDSEDSELGDDPFVTAPEPDDVELPLIVAAETPPKQEQYASTMADVEKQAEELFEELSAAEDAIGETLSTETAIAAGTVKSKTAVESRSFEDFMALRAEKQDPPMESLVTVNPTEKLADKTDATPAIRAAVQTRSSAPPASRFDSELFPELADALAETNDSQAEFFAETAAPETTENIFGLDSAAEATTASIPDDPFALASTKHGFEKVKKRDPWAAFDQRQNDNTQPVGLGTSSGLSDTSHANALTWGDEKVPQSNSVVDNANFQNRATESAFTQVSSTRPFTPEPPPTLTIEEEPTLVIPNAFPPSPMEPTTSPQSEQESSFDNDPFFTAVPGSSPALAEVPSGSNDASGSTGAVSAVSVGTMTHWSTRTWFFLIGCIIVVLLLFLPDRQNRANT